MVLGDLVLSLPFGTVVVGSTRDDEEPVAGKERDGDSVSNGSNADLSSGGETDDENESDDSLERDLDEIGTLGRLRLPSFWTAEKEPGTARTSSGVFDSLNALNLSYMSRREQLTNFIEDLKNGNPFQSALDRFQTFGILLESALNENLNVIDSDSEDESKDGERYEPQVITPAVEPKEVPMLNQVIIPQTKEPPRKRRKRRHTKTEEMYEQLAHISRDDMNDEMLMRKRIVQIRKLSVSETEKSRLIQKLMMGAHYDNIKFVDNKGEEVFRISARPNEDRHDDSAESEDEIDEVDNIRVTEADRVVSYYDEGEEILGCPHYQRNCKMECPRCRKWYGCPICHDGIEEDHKFLREKTKNVLCMLCFHPQAASEFCENCDERFAFYYCSKCKLYDNDETKDIYHCDGCGICRLGLGLGQDFFHCDGCNACLSIELQDGHKCIEGATQSDCPICGEFMFTSSKPVVFMNCGHAIHQGCYEEHTKHSYKCPSCQKTVLNMEAQFRVLDMEISLQPLPHPYSQWSCIISCNDCNAKSSCAYHVLGLKCDNCKSYNTVQRKLIKPEESDYESDISTTTNHLRRTNIRDLRSIPVNSNLLNTNYSIEQTESDGTTKTKEVKSSSGLQSQLASILESNGRTLTLPQQFMTNFDNFVNDIHSSEEEDEDDLDFLHLNKTLKSLKHSELLSDSTGTPDVSTNLDSEQAGNFITSAIEGFRSRFSTMMNEDSSNIAEEDDFNESDDNINGF